MTLFERLDAAARPEVRGRRLGINDYLEPRPSGSRAFRTSDLLSPLRQERGRFGLSVVVANAMQPAAQDMLVDLLGHGLSRDDVVSMIGLTEDGRVNYPGELSGESRPTVRYWADQSDRAQVSFWPVDVLILPAQSSLEAEMVPSLVRAASLILVDAAGPVCADLLTTIGSDNAAHPTFIRTAQNHWIFASARTSDEAAIVMTGAARCAQAVREQGSCDSECAAAATEATARRIAAAALNL